MPLLETRGAASARGFGFAGKVAPNIITYGATPYTPPQSTATTGSSPRYWLTYGFLNSGEAFKLTGFTVTSVGYPGQGATCFIGNWFYRVLTGTSSSSLVAQYQSPIISATGDQYTTQQVFEVLIPANQYFVLYFLTEDSNANKNVTHYVATADNPTATYGVASDRGGYEISMQTNLTMVNYSYINSGPPSNPITFANTQLGSNEKRNGAQWSFVITGKPAV